MNKIQSLTLALVLCFSSFVMGQGSVVGTINVADSGTVSATVFVPAGSGFVNITDLGWRLDAGVTTGLVTFRSGDVNYASTSATSASGTVVWFANTGTAVGVGEHIIIYDESTGSYILRYTSAATTTSVTVTQAISPALTTSDRIWSVVSSVARPVPNVNSQSSAMSIWLPAMAPTAITIEGNTTACRISANGVRSAYK